MKQNLWEKIQKIAPLAGATASNFRVWKCRKRIPAKWHFPLLAKAEKAGVQICIDDLNKKPKK